MIYSIKWCEVKKTGTTNGRDWTITEMNLEDSEGKTTEKVSTFEPVMSGGTIEGTIVKNDKGYLNFKKLEAPDFIKQQRKPDISKSVEKAQERTAEGVKIAQERTSWSVKTSATMRDAVMIATARGISGWDKDEIEKAILKWREWLWTNFDVESDQYPPFQ